MQLLDAKNVDSLQALSVKPFLRWAGGKSRITRHLLKYIPSTQYGTYWEPFLGAAAMYFSLAPIHSYLSDSNPDLIHCYQQVRDHPDAVYRYLKEHMAKTSEEYYYQIRDIYNHSQPSIPQAARFIYLNKTCFNGIFRVNATGKYNVPYGHRKSASIPSLQEFRAISCSLKKSVLLHQSYEVTLGGDNTKSGDFVYLDPPYPPLNKTAYFTHYTPTRFSWSDQEKVASVAGCLNDRGCFVMVSNADTPQLRSLYRDWKIHALPVVRWIAANGTRHKVSELVITNY